MKACRRINDYALAVRYLEAVKVCTRFVLRCTWFGYFALDSFYVALDSVTLHWFGYFALDSVTLHSIRFTLHLIRFTFALNSVTLHSIRLRCTRFGYIALIRLLCNDSFTLHSIRLLCTDSVTLHWYGYFALDSVTLHKHEFKSFISESVYSDSSPHFGGVQSSRTDKECYIW